MNRNGKITLAVMAASVIISTAVRFLVIAKHTDMKTGFIYHGEELLWNFLYYGIIGAAATAAVFISRNGGAKPFKPDKIGSVKAQVVGFLTMVAGMFSLKEGIDEIGAITPTEFLIVVDFVFAVIFVTIGFFTVFRVVLMALGFAKFGKRSFTPGLGYSYTLIGAYCVCRGIYCFMSRMAIIAVPEYAIEIISLIILSVVFVLFGKYLSGNASKRTRGALCFWGTSAAALVLSSSFATIIASFAAPEEVSSRIVFTSYAAESFKQASQGVDQYNLVATPWVNIVLGILAVVAVVMTVDGARRTAD